MIRQKRKLPGHAILALMSATLLSCALLSGSSEVTATAITVEGTPTPQVEPTEPEEQAATPLRLCEEPPPQEITVGATINSGVGDPNWTNCYWLDVPDGLTSITFSITGLEADLNLYAGYGYLITLQYHILEFWDSTEPETADELITLTSPKAGLYFLRVGIAGPRDPSPYTLTVTSDPPMTTSVTGGLLPELDTCGGPAKLLEFGDSANGELPPRDDRPFAVDYYCVEVPPGTPSFDVELTSSSVALSLFIRRTNPFEWADRGREEYRILTVEDPEPGAYYIEIAIDLAGATSTYTLTINSP